MLSELTLKKSSEIFNKEKEKKFMRLKGKT